MKIINCRNVNDGFIKGMDLLGRYREDVKPSRAGDVIEVPEPVATVYENSTEEYYLKMCVKLTLSFI